MARVNLSGFIKKHGINPNDNGIKFSLGVNVHETGGSNKSSWFWEAISVTHVKNPDEKIEIESYIPKVQEKEKIIDAGKFAQIEVPTGVLFRIMALHPHQDEEKYMSLSDGCIQVKALDLENPY